MVKSFLACFCTCHVLGLRLFSVSTAPGPPEELIHWKSEGIVDETSMVQTSVHSHKDFSEQLPMLENDHGRPMQVFGSVPIYGIERAHHNDSLDKWMMMFPDTYTREMLLKICSMIPPPGKCNYVGHPDNGGVSYLNIIASENEMRTSISTSCAVLKTAPATPGLCGARYAELDAPVKMYDPGGRPSKRSGLPWGLDRIDSRPRGLDGVYNVPLTGQGINVFLFDSGINCELEDFQGHCHPLLEIDGEEIVTCKKHDYTCALDRNGHGTHTAGTIASKTYGVATGVTIHAVKVLDDFGYGGWTGLVDAMDWVIDYASEQKIEKGIISASLGGVGPTAVVSEAIRKATDAGIAVVVAAGNSDTDACKELPASVKAAITVGSVDYIDNLDILSSFSNYGRCIDIFAPGSNITSLSQNRGEPPVELSGTSMACPHVAGVIALLFEQDPSLTARTVAHAVKQMSTRGCIKNLFPPGSTPNKLLYFGTDPNRHPCQNRDGQDDDYE